MSAQNLQMYFRSLTYLRPQPGRYLPNTDLECNPLSMSTSFIIHYSLFIFSPNDSRSRENGDLNCFQVKSTASHVIDSPQNGARLWHWHALPCDVQVHSLLHLWMQHTFWSS